MAPQRAAFGPDPAGRPRRISFLPWYKLASAIRLSVISGASSGSRQVRREPFDFKRITIRRYPYLGLIPPFAGAARSTAFSRSMRT